MKTYLTFNSLLLFLCIQGASYAQKYNLIEAFKANEIKTINRQISIDSTESNALFMNAKKGDGLGVLKSLSFSKGSIEIDIAGKDLPGRSFVGIAFNIKNDSTYEAVYFRPFNFMAEQQIRKSHMVQYISHPEHTWHKLRKERTDQFENELTQPPKPNDWFHVKIMLSEKSVKVFVNENKEKPDLVVERLAVSESDKIGLWTGNNAFGRFKSLTIIKDRK